MPAGTVFRDGMNRAFLMFSGLVPLVIKKLGEEGQEVATVTVPHALPRAVTCSMVIDNRLIAPADVGIFHVLASELGGLEPDQLWVAVDEAGVRWVVQEAGVMNFRTRRRLVCIREGA